MKNFVLFFSLLICSCVAVAQVTLTTDFTNTANNKGALYDVWKVANRISPVNGVGVKAGLEVNTVRMVGGINKKVNNVDVPDLDFDPVRFDDATNTYVYDWTLLKTRINGIRREGIKIHQVVIDQVPWCFQRGYTFIPTGTRDNINFRENERISIYGNSLPPFDKVAYSNFIKAMMTELVATYGQTEVLSWRIRVGSEIETPDHWFGTQQDFIDHYANTVRAVLSVLPNVKIGLHTREPLYVSQNGTNLNYKGESIRSFANGLINFCFNNADVRYDFWGVSDYLLINSSSDRDFTTKYNIMFSPLIDNPKWNTNATCDVMEYSIVTTMNAPDGKGYLTVATPHADIANLAYTNLYYKSENKGLENIYRWGMRPSSNEPESIATLKSMNGNIRFTTTKTGNPAITANQIDAIVTKTTLGNKIGAIIYNYNSASLGYQAEENVNLSLITDLPVGTVVKYRSYNYGKTQNSLENFLLNEPTVGWIKSGFDRRGDPSRTLNTDGAAAWATYTNPNQAVFGAWVYLETVARSNSVIGSEIKLSTKLNSFEFKKYEFEPVINVSIGQSPFTGTPFPIPGNIQLEYYDNGGQGVAFNDTNTGANNTFRNDKVGISSSGDGYIIGNLIGGEWLEYTVNVASSANYDFEFTFSSGKAGGGGSIGASMPDESISLFSGFTFPNTGGFNSYQKLTRTGVPLTAGQHVLRFTIGSTGFNLDSVRIAISTLPVSLISFVAKAEGNSVKLNWKTASEKNNNRFEVLKSTDGVTFQLMKQVAGANNSDQINSYQVSDPFPDKENYYKLFQIDNDGTATEKGIRFVAYHLSANKLVVYPNPSETGVFEFSKVVNWTVHNLSGQLILTGKSNKIDLSKHPEGMYLLKTDLETLKLIYR
jgi:hypothetical protein